MKIQKKISKKKMRALKGKTIEVLVEGRSEETDLLLQGRYYGQAPEIDGSVLINDGEANPGDYVNVKIHQTGDYDLVGSIVSMSQRAKVEEEVPAKSIQKPGTNLRSSLQIIA